MNSAFAEAPTIPLGVFHDFFHSVWADFGIIIKWHDSVIPQPLQRIFYHPRSFSVKKVETKSEKLK